MTPPLGRMRPLHPATHGIDDLTSRFGLEIAPSAGAPTTAGVALTGVTVASSATEPGDLFVALQGLKAHGATYAAQAVAAGAVAVLTDAVGAAACAAIRPALGVPVLVAADPRALLGDIAAWVFGAPAQGLVTVGVTGTNGKTTTTYFVDAALRRLHPTTAVLGTVELRIGDDAVESPRTTVEAPALHALLALARERGATAASLEASSHALALGRVHGLTFDVVGFTNLQRDHLDFHGTMEGYFADKARLFAPEQARRGVVVVDDAWGRRLVAEARIPVESVATHVGAPEGATADWAVVDATIGLDGVGSTFTLRGPDGESHACFSPLPGLVNVSNAALAIVLAYRAGVPFDEAVAGVGSAHAIPGRMERVIERTGGWPLALVDYAHTPDALELALQAVRPITPGRLFIVFGSDGDRDMGKRPIMGATAARLADVLIVTDENPRSEVPAQIRAEILAGAREQRPSGTDILEATSRAEAIRTALRLADDGDTIIITGKGHEPTQEIAGVFHRYNDRDVLQAAVRDALAAAEAVE
ncbi:UDP-N-acetylmuramoyl-L-alanyl-D-glutamate--2,6-diaminopimelate ligase [Pengzhenrongella frigida]|uniref:UDP-N-acetylmuramyl-tripeptide synthetase n=1 Tax=Pengzhenrongella frigida TaxID=1259133 RepID=A0A4V1ZHL7_9MICO|nr:UDP-N-acetylmuramoyl-L-alanyl-D-glutamate--2,6-diaminopimelate ligase [Cellulomonas sp. HLT2-17]RYV52484.1 UDP-N-acetylmuramoyl-L-alanyl-D-glutamate--2,6-diaminopimelate ligase [Cellulomonas sp. HLT2-17]